MAKEKDKVHDKSRDQDKDRDRGRDRDDDKGNGRPPLLEWVASGVGLLLALSILAIIGREALQGAPLALPAVAVEALEIAETEVGFTVRIRVSNRGSETASDVVVEGELKQGEETVETAETTFPYVPGGSEREGGLFFSRNPRALSMELRALGYTAP